MLCEEFARKLEADLDGELPTAERDALKAHRAVCPDCEQLTASRLELRETFREALDMQPSRALQKRLRKALVAAATSGKVEKAGVISPPAAAEQRRPTRRRLLTRPYGLAVAAVVTLALVAWWLGVRPDPIRQPEPFSQPANVLILRFAPDPDQPEKPQTGGLILANHL